MAQLFRQNTPAKGFGGYNELDFLTDAKINNNDNQDDIWNTVIGADVKNGVLEPRTGNRSVVYKNPNTQGTNKIKQHYSEAFGYSDNKDPDDNPYSKLISIFSSDDTYNALKLHAADFTYLKNLGVYPINRMWILRRFPEGVQVPNNLTDWGSTEKPPEPISTVVGWIKPDEDNFMNIGFNETWEKQTKRWDQVLFEIMDKEFGLKVGNTVSVPGWSQGILFGFLEAMGLTSDYDAESLPFGDPNVLLESPTRLTDPANMSQNIMSKFSLSLETAYEQKFIGDIDPGSAMMDIMANLTRMGTSDMKFMLSGDNDITRKLLEASRQGNSGSAWADFIGEVITAFSTAISKLFGEIVGDSVGNNSDPDNFTNVDEEFIASNDITYKKTTKTVKGVKQDPVYTEGGKVIDESRYNNAKSLGKSDKQNEKDKDLALDSFKAFDNEFVKTILASTVAKYKWALIGGVGVSTGMPTAPWHLTLGNPYTPFFSIGNMVVKNIDVKYNNEFGFNDVPTRMNVTIQVEQGRNMGAQEILSAFNNGYKRIYKREDDGTLTPDKNNLR